MSVDEELRRTDGSGRAGDDGVAEGEQGVLGGAFGDGGQVGSGDVGAAGHLSPGLVQDGVGAQQAEGLGDFAVIVDAAGQQGQQAGVRGSVER